MSSNDPQLSIVIPSIGQPLVNENDPTRVNSSLLMETASITSLEEFCVYQFFIYYETSVGRSPSSSSLLIETLPTGKIKQIDVLITLFFVHVKFPVAHQQWSRQ